LIYKEKKLLIPYTLNAGNYKLDFYDTLTGKIIKSQTITVSEHLPVEITLPDFIIDIAFKITQPKNKNEK
jgi:hypothetical protein